jgi:hypothetical protein
MIKSKLVKIEGRFVDGRYKKGIDKGTMSFLKIPLPLKSAKSKKSNKK